MEFLDISVSHKHIESKLKKMIDREVHRNPEKAYYELKRLSELLKKIIDANPNIKINNLPFPK